MLRPLSGAGSAAAPVPREAVRDALLDPACLARAIPGAHAVERLAERQFGARLRFGVGPLHGTYNVELVVDGPHDGFEFTVTGSSQGGLGTGRAMGVVRLLPLPRARTGIEFRYHGDIGGPVALAGTTLLTATARAFCAEFFRRLARDLGQRQKQQTDATRRRNSQAR